MGQIGKTDTEWAFIAIIESQLCNVKHLHTCTGSDSIRDR